MANDEQQWIKLFRFLNQRFNEIDKKLDAKADKAQADRILQTMDGIAKRLDDNDIEHAAIDSQLHRHDIRIHKLAHKLGIKFS